MSREGLLIAIEGIDGSGKTTVAKILVEVLTSLGFNAIYTHEPYASPFSNALKEYIEEFDIDPKIEVLAIAADRVHHVEKVLRPLIERGFIIITDRYYYSSIAYQGAEGIDLGWIEIVNKYCIEPDIAIYLRIPIDVALRRIKGLNRRWAFFELRERLEKALEIYEELVSRGKLIAVDATQDIDGVVVQCLKIISRHLPLLC